MLVPFASEAAHERGVSYRPLFPVYTGVTADGENLIATMRGFVGSMGNQSTLDWSMDIKRSDVFPYTNLGTGQVTGPSYGLPIQGQFIEIEINVIPAAGYDFSFDVWNDAVQGGHSTFFSVISFTTPSIDEFWTLISHPLSPHIQSLGIPVDITLALFGIVIFLAPAIIVSMLGISQGNDVFMPLLLLGLTANAFLRFWPAVTVIFIGLLCGWMIMDTLTGGTARQASSSISQTG